MPLILLVETTTRTCSVALAKDGSIIATRESGEDNDHAAVLTTYISELLSGTGIGITGLSAIAVSNGPGSYTGLRIGLSAAKGICYAAGIPLITISTLESIAWQIISASSHVPAGALLCPMIDARRMEVYTCIFDQEMNLVSKPEAMILDEVSYRGVLDKEVVLFGGDGATKARALLESDARAVFPDSSKLSAVSLCKPAFARLRAKDFADLAYSEPFYLKEFQAGVPKVKGLHTDT